MFWIFDQVSHSVFSSLLEVFSEINETYMKKKFKHYCTWQFWFEDWKTQDFFESAILDFFNLGFSLKFIHCRIKLKCSSALKHPALYHDCTLLNHLCMYFVKYFCKVLKGGLRQLINLQSLEDTQVRYFAKMHFGKFSDFWTKSDFLKIY